MCTVSALLLTLLQRDMMQFDTVYRVGIKVDGWSERICGTDELSLE